MTLASADSLLDSLRQFKLLTSAQLHELGRLQASFADSKALSRELLQRGWLTAFQVNQLLQGRGHELLLSSYVLLDRLGEGGMGQVYKARDSKLGKLVALKLIHKERIANVDAVRRFKRERAAAALNHPNVVLAYDGAEVAGTHMLVMEYVAGIDLARLVKEKGPLPFNRACDYMRQAALGLQHAHERGLVHRDIKPSNLLLTRDSVVKIADFGLARLETGQSADEQTAAATLTHNGLVIGTPDYIAPEQARQAHTADIRSDIYSLGCTFYCLLTGRPAFPGGSSVEKLLRHQLEEPAPIETLRRDVPPPVAAVIRRMMAKTPAARFQTPAEVVAALSAPRRSIATAIVRNKSWRRWPVAAALLLLFGTTVLVWWLASGGSAERPSGKSGPEAVAVDSKVVPAWRCRFAAERQRQLREMGGTEQSEQAVSKGLNWLAQHQQRDGSWSCQGYDANMGGTFPVAATALGVLPFLAAGETPESGRYQKNVADAVRWLIKDQEADGGYRSSHNGRQFYEHAMATTALCEAYGLTGDSRFKAAAQKSLNYLAKGQAPDGGWKYQPGQKPGDTSVVGWALEALETGKQAGLTVPAETLDKAAKFLDAVAAPTGYQYAPGLAGPNPSPACTAIGILGRLQLGRSAQDPRTAAEVEWLMKVPPASGRENMYYYYHAQRAVYHTGVRWQSWNSRMRDLVVGKQASDGSWPPVEADPISKAGGRLVATSFALLILETYYRYRPLHLENKR